MKIGVTSEAKNAEMHMVRSIFINTAGQGLLEVTSAIQSLVHQSSVREGLCVIHLKHTSASLLIQENADPSAKRDLERWLCRLVPERDSLYTHTSEGPDDMPSHIKAALTQSSLSIPIEHGRLCLGTWQGIYLWEHRTAAHRRELSVYIG